MMNLVSILCGLSFGIKQNSWWVFQLYGVYGLFWSESIPKGMGFLGCFDTTPRFLKTKMKNLKKENNK